MQNVGDCLILQQWSSDDFHDMIFTYLRSILRLPNKCNLDKIILWWYWDYLTEGILRWSSDYFLFNLTNWWLTCHVLVLEMLSYSQLKIRNLQYVHITCLFWSTSCKGIIKNCNKLTICINIFETFFLAAVHILTIYCAKMMIV